MRPFHTTSFLSSSCFCLCHASIPRCQLHHHLPVVKGSLCNTAPLPLLRLLSEQRQGKQRRSMLSDATCTLLPKVLEWASAATSSPCLSTCGHLSAQTDLHSNTLPSAPGKTDWLTLGKHLELRTILAWPWNFKKEKISHKLTITGILFWLLMVNFYCHDLLTSWYIKVQHATIQRAKIGPLVASRGD